jgi:hypothetical protein
MIHFILRQAFNEWSENCNVYFEFKQPKIHPNLIKQNLRVSRSPEHCHIYFVLRDDIDILVLFTHTMEAKRRIYTFENTTKSLLKMVYLDVLQFLIQT